MFSQHNTKLSLESLCNQAESQFLERKGRDTKISKLASELIGFLNADGGTLVFGISDDGAIEDLQALNDTVLNKYRSLMHDQITPSSHIELEEIVLPSGELIFVYHIEPDNERVFSKRDNEDVFKRIGDENKILNREAVKSLEYDRHIRQFEEEPRSDFEVNDLDDQVCLAYQKKMNFEGSFEELALKRMLAKKKDDKVVYNNATVLLFAENPTKYISNASVRYVRYDGEYLEPGQKFNVIKDQRFEACLPKLIDEVKAFLQISFRDYFYLNMDIGKFEKIQEFPEDAWLEGLVNAICHRSYNVQGNEIVLKHYDDRLEISNSGPLPAQVNIENICEERYSRNPRIARVLFEMDYVRELNEGVPRIYSAMAESMLAEPNYLEKHQRVYLILKNNVSKSKATILSKIHTRIENEWDSLNENARNLIKYLLVHFETDVSEAARVIGVTDKTARTRLQALCDKSILERISEKERDKNAKYRFAQK